MTTKQRAIAATVVAVALFWGLTAGIGYPATGDPEWLFIVPVTLVGCALLMGVLIVVMEWIERGDDR